MLPRCPCLDEPYPVPKFSIVAQDGEAFDPQLRNFSGEFDECFSRSEPRDNLHRYLIGQFSQVERKSIEPIALQVEGGEVRSMRRFISDVVWDEAGMIKKYHELVASDMSDPAGVLIFDESGFAKKGEDSAGVGKQYCGSLGKVENAQVGVFAAYASPRGVCTARRGTLSSGIDVEFQKEPKALSNEKLQPGDDVRIGRRYFEAKPCIVPLS